MALAITEPTEPRATGEPSLRAVWISVGILFAIYVALFVAGIRFFVFKTAVLPVLLAYGLLVRQRAAFVRDWLPLLSAVVLFDAIRGAIWLVVTRGYQVYHIQYVIDLERAMFGVPAATIPLQTLRSPALDAAAVLVHASHFAFFLFFGLALWHARRSHFWLFRRSLVFVMLFGLIGYAVIPTAPPWVAASYNEIPPMPHISREIYTHYVSEAYGVFATNPVAAMPSLHVAFPVMCAIVGWRAYGPLVGVALWIYSAMVVFVSIYLGEHYAVDGVAGALVAWLAVVVSKRMASLELSFRTTLALSAAAIAITAVLVQAARAIPVRAF